METQINKSLYHIEKEYLQIVDQLIELEGELTPELEQALIINKAEFKIKAGSYAGIIKTTDYKISEIDDLIELLKNKKKSLENMQVRLKKSIEEAMNLYDIKKVEVSPYIALSLRPSISIEVANEFSVPDEYMRMSGVKEYTSYTTMIDDLAKGEIKSIKKEVDKVKIKADIKSGKLTLQPKDTPKQTKQFILTKLSESNFTISLEGIIHSENNNLQIK